MGGCKEATCVGRESWEVNTVCDGWLALGAAWVAGEQGAESMIQVVGSK